MKGKNKVCGKSHIQFCFRVKCRRSIELIISYETKRVYWKKIMIKTEESERDNTVGTYVCQVLSTKDDITKLEEKNVCSIFIHNIIIRKRFDLKKPKKPKKYIVFYSIFK